MIRYVKKIKNYVLPAEEWYKFLNQKSVLAGYRCTNCRVELFQRHHTGCGITVCSECGQQRKDCNCAQHNPWFSKWEGFFPGELQQKLFGLTAEEFTNVQNFFFINPKNQRDLNDILVILDQDVTLKKDDRNFIIRRAQTLDAVITTAFVSKDATNIQKLIKEIKKNNPTWVIPFTLNMDLNMIERLP